MNNLGEVGRSRNTNQQCVTFQVPVSPQVKMSSMKVKVQKARCHFGSPHIKMRMTIGTEGREQEDPRPGPEGLGHSR